MPYEVPSSQMETPPPSDVPVVMKAESSLKRRREDVDENNILPIQKKVKSQIVIIDD